MDEWVVVAILDMSTGNASVGEMWQVTKIFTSDTRLFDVMKWAAQAHRDQPIEAFKGKLQLTIAR